MSSLVTSKSSVDTRQLTRQLTKSTKKPNIPLPKAPSEGSLNLIGTGDNNNRFLANFHTDSFGTSDISLLDSDLEEDFRASTSTGGKSSPLKDMKAIPSAPLSTTLTTPPTLPVPLIPVPSPPSTQASSVGKSITSPVQSSTTPSSISPSQNFELEEAIVGKTISPSSSFVNLSKQKSTPITPTTPTTSSQFFLNAPQSNSEVSSDDDHQHKRSKFKVTLAKARSFTINKRSDTNNVTTSSISKSNSPSDDESSKELPSKKTRSNSLTEKPNVASSINRPESITESSQPAAPPQPPPMSAMLKKLWKNQPGVSPEILDSLDKKEIQRQECIHEFIVSERAYVEDLNHIVKDLLFKLVKFEVIDERNCRRIFGEMQKIASYNQILLDNLEQYKKEVFPLYEDICQFLIPFFEKCFDVYNLQCQSINQSNIEIKELQSNPNYQSFMSTLTTNNSNVDPIGLNAYVIKPLQRVTKYPLLLRELKKFTPPEHPSYGNVLKAQTLIEANVKQINECTRENDAFEKMTDVVSRIDVSGCNFGIDIAAPNRQLIKEGELELWVSKRSSKAVYAFLFNDALLLTRKKIKLGRLGGSFKKKADTLKIGGDRGIVRRLSDNKLANPRFNQSMRKRAPTHSSSLDLSQPYKAYSQVLSLASGTTDKPFDSKNDTLREFSFCDQNFTYKFFVDRTPGEHCSQTNVEWYDAITLAFDEIHSPSIVEQQDQTRLFSDPTQNIFQTKSSTFLTKDDSSIVLEAKPMTSGSRSPTISSRKKSSEPDIPSGSHLTPSSPSKNFELKKNSSLQNMVMVDQPAQEKVIKRESKSSEKSKHRNSASFFEPESGTEGPNSPGVPRLKKKPSLKKSLSIKRRSSKPEVRLNELTSSPSLVTHTSSFASSEPNSPSHQRSHSTIVNSSVSSAIASTLSEPTADTNKLPVDSIPKEAPSPVTGPAVEATPPKTPNKAAVPNALQKTLWKYQEGVTEEVLSTLNKAEINRQECLYELILTEESYVKNLDFVLEGIYKPLKKFQVLKTKEMNDIFGEIRKIHRVQTQILTSLKARQQQTWPICGDLSDLLIPFFSDLEKHYSTHCTQINSINQSTQDLIHNKVEFAQFMETLTKNEGVDVLGLQSYIILPLQRLTKYSLLMREILKFTPQDSPYRADLETAANLANEQLTKINENTRESENYQKTIAIQQSLDCSDMNFYVSIVSTGRLYITEFPIEIEENSKRKKKISGYAFLFSDILIVAKPAEGKKTGYKILASPLNMTNIIRVEDKGFYEYNLKITLKAQTCDKELRELADSTFYVVKIPIEMDKSHINYNWKSHFAKAYQAIVSEN